MSHFQEKHRQFLRRRENQRQKKRWQTLISKVLCVQRSPFLMIGKNCDIPTICQFYNLHFRFHSSGNVVYDTIDQYCEYLKNNGIGGVLVNGTTGEGTCLRVDERKKLAEEWQKV